MNPILVTAKEIENQLIADRRYLHQNPEIGFDLPLTATYVKTRLKEMGYEVQDICECGFVAIAGKEGGKCILLRGDMDALPMEEKTDLPFKSTNGYAHTCGHDTHTAMLLGAAQILKQYEDQLEGQVKFCFQPAEETIEGAKVMVEAGVMENPHVDAVFGAHTSIPMPVGAVRCLEGPVCASSDIFTINITGKGSHGAMPEMGVDPINVAAHMVINLEEILAREVSALESCVLTFGSIHSGEAPNVVPGTATLGGTLRAFNPEVRKFAKKRLEEIMAATAATFRAEATISYQTETPPVVNTPEFVKEMHTYIREITGEDLCITEGPRVMGSDDFAFFSEKAQGAMFHIGMGTTEEGHDCGLHNPGVWFDERSIAICAAVYANCCLNWLKNNK